nr:hypothetical protein Iba_chr08bCG8110 [Ipomoea batatas]
METDGGMVGGGVEENLQICGLRRGERIKRSVVASRSRRLCVCQTMTSGGHREKRRSSGDRRKGQWMEKQ